MNQSTEPRFLLIGQVTKPHGVRGEVRVLPHTDVLERFTWLEMVYVDEDNPRPIKVESARVHKSFALLKLAGYHNRQEAESLRGEQLFVPEEEAIPLEEDEYFLYQLEGLQVFTESGQLLGLINEVLETKANNVFVVQGEKGEILLPDIPEVIQEIDFGNGRVQVHLMPGLIP